MKSKNHVLKSTIRLFFGILLVAGLAFSISCRKSKEDPDPDTGGGGTGPAITGFTPVAAWEGETIVINGTNLDGATAISFNRTDVVTIVTNSSTSISVVVPAGATTGTVSVIGAKGNTTSSMNFTVIKEYIVTTFEDGFSDLFMNSAWWDYHDNNEVWTYTLPATSTPYQGSNYIHMDGEDSPTLGNADWWVGGCGHGNGDATDPSFGIPAANANDVWLNLYMRSDGNTSLAVTLRQTNSEQFDNSSSQFVNSAAGTWQLKSINLSSLGCVDSNYDQVPDCTGDGIPNPDLINGISFNVVNAYPPGAGNPVSVDIDLVTITVGGPAK
jgi:hypothetical protein